MCLHHCLVPNICHTLLQVYYILLSSGVLQILPSGWLSYSLPIGDRPLVAKGIDNSRFAKF